ncbi:N-acetylglucosamine-6-phosphate deacetylase [Cyanobacterium aponinum FACHB-4101]|uniref:N-acetylglucosamine 6-phosphate deacetylase n=1 Tax=Cyanobacterium aponinum (strain PCC 10605) TaxID=755178 RepID=K9Z1R5_CYAAP|nr:N-acetylglucosamine-6-phosphate deacetylase [Cyanobacterium aponinum]AFZ53146.1 N-acetylglucosamine 6-phosphate deacetylase [Cyanobacterium aponinum PCC 10605]MBD2395414.1 N-acetylglucosamine-6-phosphate deacetylase [Cyanobacterium aponinum FACHB-4101]
MTSTKTSFIITNGRLVGYSDLQTLVIENGNIKSIQPSHFKTNSDLDLEGDYLSLGGFDLQINGGLGLAFPDLCFDDIDKLHDICAYLWSTGVDQFLPTIVTTSVEKIHQSLKVIQEFKREKPRKNEAEIIGVHLEGPFLNYEKRGAHPPEYLLPLTLDNIKIVLGAYADVVKIITLAPELDEKKEVIPYLQSLGIVISLGHSQATAEDAIIAFQQGASMVTHAFNAMPNLHHRQAGLLGEAIVNPHVYCGLIADGNHVCPTMLKLILQASNYHQGVFVVSDALAPIGLGDGVYPWDSRTIEVKNGTARLPDGTLSGTTLPLFVGVQNLYEWGICNIEDAIALVTDAPRKALNMPCLEVSSPANLIRWHEDKQNKKLHWQRIQH